MSEPIVGSTQEEQLKAALWYSVGRVVDDCTLNMDVNSDPRFIGALSEMLWAQIGSVATDLEAFANHTGRTTINATDAVLLGRGNDGLKEALQDSATAAKSQGAKK